MTDVRVAVERFQWFDCLRCLAVALVIIHHCPAFGAQFPAGLSFVFEQIQAVGWVGVDLFFVLSGFLVSGLLFQEYDVRRTLDIRRFLIRRAFKIFPGFYLLVAVTALYQICFQGSVFKSKMIVSLLFLQNYLAGNWPHAWTLAIEVHFYILLAGLLFLLSKTHRQDWLRPLPWIIGVILGADLILRLVHFHRLPAGAIPIEGFQQTHLHLDVLAAGVLLRYLYNYHRENLAVLARAPWVWLGVSLVLIVPSEWLHEPHPFYLTALLPTLNWIAFFIVVFLATLVPYPTTGLGQRLVAPFDYIGRHSYGIYLWHFPVRVWILERLQPAPAWIYLLCFLAGSIAVGIFFSETLEMPMLHLRNRLFPSKTSRAGDLPSLGQGVLRRNL